MQKSEEAVVCVFLAQLEMTSCHAGAHCDGASLCVCCWCDEGPRLQVSLGSTYMLMKQVIQRGVQ